MYGTLCIIRIFQMFCMVAIEAILLVILSYPHEFVGIGVITISATNARRNNCLSIL